MDAHVFRIAGRELLTLLEGSRVEKIHGPETNVLVFRIFAQGLKFSLLFRFERQNPLLLITKNPPENPPTPSAFVMRLRKYVNNRRLTRGELDWQNRRLAFAIPGSGDEPLWLVLDLRQGASLCAELPPEFSSQPLWPEPALVDSLCREAPESERPESAFVGYPVLTPLLRSSLGYMDALDGRALLIDLEADNDELFAYSGGFAEKGDGSRRHPGGAALKFLSAWPLPDAMLEKMSLEPTATIPQPDLFLEQLAQRHNALSMVSALGEQSFYKGRLEKRQSDLEKPERKEEKRLKRLIRNLEAEEGRLRKMREQRGNALVLQQNLWRIQADGRFGRLCVPRSLAPDPAGPAGQPDSLFGPCNHPCDGHTPDAPDGNASDGCDVIELDVRLTVLENMKKMFKQSDRAARGLGMLRERKDAALAELDRLGRQVPGIRPEMSGRFCPDPNVSGNVPGGVSGDVQNDAAGQTGCAASADSAISELINAAPSGPSAGELKCRFSTLQTQYGPMRVWDHHPEAAVPRSARAVAAKAPGKSHGKSQHSSRNKQSRHGQGSLSKNIARFVSSDGFIMLRGKNAQGNNELLRVGSPFDLWFHAESGPSAHLIIRRSHAKEAIPERTMAEAGCLTGLKSAQRTQDKVRVMCALLSDVQALKGAPAGTVRVSRVEMTMLVKLEPELEEILSAPPREIP